MSTQAVHQEGERAMQTREEGIVFRTSRFDFISELPAGYNAGNRFYGRDVAKYLAEELGARGFAADFLDEGWG